MWIYIVVGSMSDMWIYIVVGSLIAFVVATGYIIIVFFVQKIFGIVLFLGDVLQKFW